MLCHSCGECLIEQSKSVFICQTCTTDIKSGDALYFCLKCKKEDKHEHKLKKLKNRPEQDEENKEGDDKEKYLESLLDEYYNLDFEDVIGGGQVKTRFKYRRVAHEDFGLTEDEILLLDDKQLNKLVSLKKYRPYKDLQDPADQEGEVSLTVKRKQREITDQVNVHRVRHLKKQLEGELKEKRKMLKQSLQQELEQDKEKFFKQPSGKGAAAAARAEEVSKNRKRREKYREKKEGDGEDNQQAQIEEDEEARKKRKRMALYGVRQ